MLHLPLAAQHATDDPAAAVVRRQLAAIGGLVAKASKVVVVSGAGVSCSCGIPVRLSALCPTRRLELCVQACEGLARRRMASSQTSPRAGGMAGRC